jgi:8-oxo-dGTP pyrophosphatase MutT (NUDIX family)
LFCCSLELGESLAACAVREVLEEASISLRCDTAPGDDSSDATADVSALGSYDPADDSEGFSKGLRRPTAFAAVDSIVRGEGGRVKFHYVVVEVRRAYTSRTQPRFHRTGVPRAAFAAYEEECCGV